jgi:capsular exopolysaccharide synthesis family protein
VFPKVDTDRSNGRGDLVTASNPRSAVAEAYRTLRTNLQFSNVDRDVQTVLVTSAGPGDGKTTVVANLGVALAESGKNVLVIDCDLRQPGLHALFGLPLAPGLTNAMVEGLAEPPINTTGVPGLSVLTAGDLAPNPAELVASARLARLLADLRSRYDVVLIDVSPVSLVVDAATLASIADGVLLVISAGKTKRQLAQRAKEQLDQVGARILGAVLNNARLEKNVEKYHATKR